MWFIIGFSLLVFEMLLPGVYLMWLAASAFFVAVASSVFTMTLTVQVVTFSVVSLFLVIIAKIYIKSPEKETDHPLDNRMFSYVGTDVTLFSAIKNGQGKVQIDDTFWVVEGPDLPKGSICVIIGVKGMHFEVRAKDA